LGRNEAYSGNERILALNGGIAGIAIKYSPQAGLMPGHNEGKPSLPCI